MSILSIQSHVSYGHVGNAAGVFILQRMGFDVWPVHTVLFSNQPGYGSFQGAPVDSRLIADIVSGVEDRGVFSTCRAVVGGYLGTAETGDAMLSAVERVKRANPESLFFCDPVMGDTDNGFYVSEEVVRFYEDRGAAAADILKPNAFELGVLTGETVRDPMTAAAASRPLIEKWNLRAVVVSSVPVPDRLTDNGQPAIACMVVTKDQAWCVETPFLPVDQKGSGDAFMALFLANTLLNDGDFSIALEASASAIWSIMNTSVRANCEELPLIAEQHKFFNPSSEFKALLLDEVTD